MFKNIFKGKERDDPDLSWNTPIIDPDWKPTLETPLLSPPVVGCKSRRLSSSADQMEDVRLFPSSQTEEWCADIMPDDVPVEVASFVGAPTDFTFSVENRYVSPPIKDDVRTYRTAYGELPWVGLTLDKLILGVAISDPIECTRHYLHEATRPRECNRVRARATRSTLPR